MHSPEHDDREPRPLPEPWIQMARTSYRVPGETPRDEMWSAVEARLFGSTPIQQAASGRRWGRGWMVAAAASVALLAGVGLGRWSTTRWVEIEGAPFAAERGPIEASPLAPPARSGMAVRLATARHLSDAEALLAFVQADARAGRTDHEVGVWGRSLLTRTRLLLDSPAIQEPSLRLLLEDLEVILAQVTLLADPAVDASRVREELDLIARGVEQAGLRGRIQTALPGIGAGLAQSDD